MKVELHTHLDGNVRPATILDIAKQEGIDLSDKTSATTPQELHEDIRFKIGMNLEQCLLPFALTTSVMQSEKALYRVMYEHIEDLAADGVTHAEIRFCPLLHTSKLNVVEVMDAVIGALEEAMIDDILEEGSIILSAIRNVPEDDSRILSNLYHKFEHVSGLDLAGGEDGFPPECYSEFFKLASMLHIPFTIHAGETLNPEDGLNNIRTAIKMGAKRISHAVPIILDDKLVDEVIEKDITLELCPTSNMYTGAIKSYEEHPIRKLFDKGVRVALCTDDAILCDNITLSSEIEQMVETFGFGPSDIKQMQKYAKEAMFFNVYQQY